MVTSNNIVTSYRPAVLSGDELGWGIGIDLQSIASKRSWGCSDLTDLRNFVAWAANQNASLVKIASLLEKSDHSLNSVQKIAYDIIYLDIEMIGDYEESLFVQRFLLAPEFRQKIFELKEKDDLEGIRKEKLLAASECYRHFRDVHIKRNTVRAAAFREFQKKEKVWLREYAVFKAWLEISGLHNCNSSDLNDEFILANYERIEYFEYIQWLIDLQLGQIGDYCFNRHMPIGLCMSISEAASNLLDNISTSEQFISRLQIPMLHAGSIIINWSTLEKNAHIFSGIDNLLDSMAQESQKLQCLIIINDDTQQMTIDSVNQRSFAVVEFDSELVNANSQFADIQESTFAISLNRTKKLFYFELLPTLFLPPNDDTAVANEVLGSLEEIVENENLKLIIERIKALSKIKAENKLASDVQQSKTIVPRATYRLQLNKTFTFKDAAAVVPYLAELGISHCYVSPILKANAGSMHGYDIVDHNQLNPEIGTMADWENFTTVLKEHGISLIVDIVPNHMGIGSGNMWWHDVLENGTDSVYSDYFDVDWQPIKKELSGKILLPILGEPYGKVVKNGQLSLHFNADEGTFSISYFDKVLPINPLSYPSILGKRLDTLKERLGSENENAEEYLSILDAFAQLRRLSDDPAKRFREQRVQMKRLHELCKRNSQITEFMNQNLQEFVVDGTNILAEQRLHDLLEQQAYRLSFWRVSSDEINYRRFFDIDSLAAIRMEDARVFAEAHHLIFKFIKEQKIEGLRIDHPDGLFDPAKYFEDLQRETAKTLGLPLIGGNNGTFGDSEFLPFYVVIEKILAPFEHLPNNWKVHGTVGYDYLNASLRLLIDSENKEQFEKIYSEFIGQSINVEELKLKCKDLILNSVLASELYVLAHRLSRLAESSWYYRDFSLGSIRDGLKEVIKYFPVYRTYISGAPIDKSDRSYIDWAVHLAKKNSSAVNGRVYDFLYDVLTLDLFKSIDDLFASAEEKTDFTNRTLLFVMRFQQYTGPVMAKSIEDTMFYRYNRFIALNEVGGEPERFGMNPAAFHFQNQQRQQKRPYEMIGTSTHDTKRSEDVRTRLAALSEIPAVWQEKVMSWQNMNKLRKTLADNQIFPDANDEYLIYQTLVGVLPLNWGASAPPPQEDVDRVIERVQQYLLKAAREAKIYTSWINSNETYEQYILSFVKKILCANYNPFFEDLLVFHDSLKDVGLINSLVQTVIKLTSPGVPDIYQGCEFWDFSLVDPDNRRPVNFNQYKNFDTSPVSLTNLIKNRNDGAIKYIITKSCLSLRKKNPDLFTKGQYIPLEIIGPAKENLLAYLRLLDDSVCLTAVPLKVSKLLKQSFSKRSGDFFENVSAAQAWEQTKIVIPSGIRLANLKNAFSGKTIYVHSNRVDCDKILVECPINVSCNW